MNTFDDAIKPIMEIQESILKKTRPFNTAFATQQQLIKSITSPVEYVLQHNPALSAIQKLEQEYIRPQLDVVNNTYPNLNPLTEFLILTKEALEAATGTEAVKSLIGAKTALYGLSSCIHEVTLKDSDVYLPEQLIPDNYTFNVEPESVEYKKDENQSGCLSLKKLSPLDAFNIICTLISILFTVIAFLQSQINPSQEQVQTIIEEQSETNKILQQQLDATQKTVDYLSTLLSEIQTNGEDTDSQSTNSSLFNNSQSESSISPSDPDVLNKN